MHANRRFTVESACTVYMHKHQKLFISKLSYITFNFESFFYLLLLDGIGRTTITFMFVAVSVHFAKTKINTNKTNKFSLILIPLQWSNAN